MTFWVILSALWLGVLTSVSPCPLASNIAAISFIGRQIGDKRGVIVSGVLYTIGRTLAYIVLGAGIVAGLLASGEVSRFLQQYLNEALGPALILLGMILLGMLGEKISLNLTPDSIKEKAEKNGVWFAMPLGVIFALSFCPVSAGIFFRGVDSLIAQVFKLMAAAFRLRNRNGVAGHLFRFSDCFRQRIYWQSIQLPDQNGDLGPPHCRNTLHTRRNIL